MGETMKSGVWSACYKCRSDMWIPQALHEAAMAGRGTIEFYCAYGHGQVYAVGETEADKLRRERDRLAQQIAQRDDEIAHQLKLREAAERSVSAMRGQVTRIKNRVGNGVCPCCNRSFSDLTRHMHTKHPEYAINNVVRLKPESAA